MSNKIANKIRAYKKNKAKAIYTKKLLKERQEFIQKGQIPWSKGYNEFKVETIINNINNQELLNLFKLNKLPEGYGYRLDERVVEYPWILSNLSNNKEKLLDAGSTFNFDFIVNHRLIEQKDLTIYTFSPENKCFNERGISYVYGDLREMPFKDNWFDTIVSQSTIEHIDMDNSIYGYDISHNKDETKKSYEYIKAVKEMIRVLKNNGSLFITFPFGKFENHGFFQQFDKEMLEKIISLFEYQGIYNASFFKYLPDGWMNSNLIDCKDSESFNPHTGKGKKDDFAAHSRAICCIHFKKNK